MTEGGEAEEGETGAETGTGRGGETGETETEEGDTDQSGLHPILIFYPPNPAIIHHTVLWCEAYNIIISFIFF